MGRQEQVVYLPVSALKPYKNNPRVNKEAVEAVVESIREFGFRSPIIIDEACEVINGHTRLKAAKKLGMDSVPCIRVDDLSEEQKRKYRLIDNKTSEYAKWDKDKLEIELVELDFNEFNFDFDFSGDLKKNKRWEASKKRCNLKDAPAFRKADGAGYLSLFKAGKDGAPLAELKTPENVDLFAFTATDYVLQILGTVSSWALMTTPRRRHASADFHFATSVCEQLARQLGIKFYPDAVITANHDRLHPRFEIVEYPKEQNILLYDDILTTGVTMVNTRAPLVRSGKTVFTLVSIDNH